MNPCEPGRSPSRASAMKTTVHQRDPHLCRSRAFLEARSGTQEGKQAPLARHALQRVGPAVFELDPGTDH